MKLRTRLFIGLTVIAIAFGVTGFLVTGTDRKSTRLNSSH